VTYTEIFNIAKKIRANLKDRKPPMVLFLNRNNLSDDGSDKLVPLLTLSNLKAFDLSENHLGEGFERHLIESLKVSFYSMKTYNILKLFPFIMITTASKNTSTVPSTSREYSVVKKSSFRRCYTVTFRCHMGN
jgi:hypothetical protein